MEGNIVSYLDTLLLPGRLYFGVHDPEGLIATIPAISTALLGIYVGSLLKGTTVDKNKNTALRLAIIGVIPIVLGHT